MQSFTLFGFDMNSLNYLHTADLSSEDSFVMILSVVDLCRLKNFPF